MAHSALGLTKTLHMFSTKRQAKPDLAHSVLSFTQAKTLHMLSVVHAEQDRFCVCIMKEYGTAVGC